MANTLEKFIEPKKVEVKKLASENPKSKEKIAVAAP